MQNEKEMIDYLSKTKILIIICTTWKASQTNEIKVAIANSNQPSYE